MKTEQPELTTTAEGGPTSYEVVLASLLFLMTRYARQPDPIVLRGIRDHLQRLARHPDQDSSFMIRTSERLMDQWLAIATQSAGRGRHPSRPSLTGSTLH